MSDDFATAARYVRGELADAERDAFEERLVAEAELHALTAAADEELLDEHVAGRVSGRARAHLEARLAADPALRFRLDLSRALFGRARQHAATRAPTPARRRSWWWWAAPLALAAAVLALLVWPRGGDAPREVVTVAIAAPTRSSATPDVRVPDGTRTLRLVLALPVAPGQAVRVVGPRGAVAAALAAAEDGNVVVEISASALADGPHDVIVTPETGAPAVFPIRISRR